MKTGFIIDLNLIFIAPVLLCTVGIIISALMIQFLLYRSRVFIVFSLLGHRCGAKQTEICLKSKLAASHVLFTFFSANFLLLFYFKFGWERSMVIGNKTNNKGSRQKKLQYVKERVAQSEKNRGGDQSINQCNSGIVGLGGAV